ncbi:MAG TPA: cupin-like domain-containing protein [Steroidobacteraceae bacterium]
MTAAMAPAHEWTCPDRAVFLNEIVPANRPAVLRGLVADWPAVQAGRRSAQAQCEYIKSFDAGRSVDLLLGAPSINGRFFYSEDLEGLNFERRPEKFSAVLERLLAHLDDAEAPAISMQSTSIPECLPHFAELNSMALAEPSAVPRIWIGNAVTVATHYDISDNIACVVGGRRRFTFFPPEQIGNLYVGPIHFTPAGQPVSMVSLDEPDLVRYPRYRQALAAAQTAELGPGDAVYIPYFWWHHVKSLERFNVLVNYWWDPAPVQLGSPYDCLLHGFLTLRHLPPNQRAAWRAVFDHYVFQTGDDPVAHLPAERRGALGAMTPELAAHIRAALLKRLQRP